MTVMRKSSFGLGRANELILFEILKRRGIPLNFRGIVFGSLNERVHHNSARVNQELEEGNSERELPAAEALQE